MNIASLLMNLIPAPFRLWAAGIAVVAALAAGATWLHIDRSQHVAIGEANTQKKWDEDKEAIREAEHVLSLANAKLTTNLQADADKLRKDKDETISAINARLVTALGDYSMLQRATARREGDLPNSAGTCAGGTGTGLARADAGFLAGYSADAAKLDASYRQCIRQYNRVRSAQPQAPEVK